MGIIYKIISPSNKVYIGKTYDLRKRINCHKSYARKGRGKILHNSIRKYGWEAHHLEVLENIDDSILNDREMYYIEKYNSYYLNNPDGMNMTLGGEGQRSTWMHDTERRKKQSELFKGPGSPFYGKHHTDETKKILANKARERNLKDGRRVPDWGVEKGRMAVMKKVLCYDSSGVFLKEYESCTAAAKDLGINKGSEVSRVCSGKSTNALGFVFRYKTDDEIPKKIEVEKINKQSVKRPVLYLSKKLKIIKEYPSSQEASVSLGIPKTTINRASYYNNLKPIRSGHIFIYKDLFMPTAVGFINK